MLVECYEARNFRIIAVSINTEANESLVHQWFTKTLIGVYVMKNILTVSTLRTLLNNSTYNYTSRTYTTMLGVLKK